MFRPNLTHGILELDDKPAELAIRPIAVERKNDLFLVSEHRGHAAAILCTFIESANHNGINPEKWRTQVLTHI